VQNEWRRNREAFFHWHWIFALTAILEAGAAARTGSTTWRRS
jgi:hypothetical protein